MRPCIDAPADELPTPSDAVRRTPPRARRIRPCARRRARACRCGWATDGPVALQAVRPGRRGVRREPLVRPRTPPRDQKRGRRRRSTGLTMREPLLPHAVLAARHRRGARRSATSPADATRVQIMEEQEASWKSRSATKKGATQTASEERDDERAGGPSASSFSRSNRPSPRGYAGVLDLAHVRFRGELSRAGARVTLTSGHAAEIAASHIRRWRRARPIAGSSVQVPDA